MKDTKEVIQVSLKAHTNVSPIDLASFAAKVCYQSTEPEWGKTLDIDNILFKTGHHTTLQHFFFTFMIEGISVGDITFGMHLASPFYDSDQRSGRYCAKMFLEPDFKKIESYIKRYWPKVSKSELKEVMEYVEKAVGVYHLNIEKATKVAKKFMKKERPYVSEKTLEQNGPEIAQEQMRMFIPTIFPTGFTFTLNLTALAAMYYSAHNPVMRDVTGRMVKEVLSKFPELSFMFNGERRSDDWAPEISKATSEIKYEPELRLLTINGEIDFISPDPSIMHPVDLLQFTPETMNNATGHIGTEVSMSIATMGQDQRHRTLKRSTPVLTGDFYLPSIPKECKLENMAVEIMKDWLTLSQKVPKTLATVLAPYGAMVYYLKKGSFNAIAHEQFKRLCWCAQEEIYNLSRLLREQIEARGGYKKLLSMFEPPCYKDGICKEGNRYCGRNIKLRKKGSYTPKRKV